jgi:hypothetical protein
MMYFPSDIPVTVTFALIFFWLSCSRDIALQPIRQFNVRSFRHRWKSVLIATTVWGLVGAAGGVAGAANHAGAVWAVVHTVVSATGRFADGVARHVADVTLLRVAVGATLGATLGAVFGMVVGAVKALFEESVIEDTIRPNEGIRRSLHVSTFGAVIGSAFGVSFGASTGVVIGAAFGAAGDDVVFYAVNWGSGGAAFGAAGCALLFGGRTVFQHYLLRLLLWASGRFPRNITAFLDWTEQRALVQRVGGGWRFVHRTLQERFAERYEESHPNQHRTPAPAAEP